MAKLLDLTTPGDILREFLDDRKISANKLARDIDVPANRILGILHATRAVTADTALRLGRYFGTSPQMWLNLQTGYDLDLAKRTIGAAIERRIRPLPAPTADAAE